MNRLLLVICALLLAACSSKVAPADAKEVSPADARDKFLAYEHSITIDAEEDKVKPLFQKLAAACEADRENRCSVMNSSLEAGRYDSANIRVRAKAPGINKLLALAAAGGDLARQETRVVDLARPIADNAKRLEMLRSYQQKLSELERRPGLDAEALIKLAHEQASVQSDLETSAGESAHLMERVNLDILTVTIYSRHQQSFWAPIRDAVMAFGGNLSSGIAGLVTGLAYLLPWLFALALVVWLVRQLWRRFFRK
jgi:hypothetical protein